jgi:hypothetical protein
MLGSELPEMAPKFDQAALTRKDFDRANGCIQQRQRYLGRPMGRMARISEQLGPHLSKGMCGFALYSRFRSIVWTGSGSELR